MDGDIYGFLSQVFEITFNSFSNIPRLQFRMRNPDNSVCQDLMIWTKWKSASNADNGDDFEILADHVKFFG